MPTWRAARAALVQAQAEETDASRSSSATRTSWRRASSPRRRSTPRRPAPIARSPRVANASANINAAEANARNSQVAVDYTIIRAPFDGVILSKSANVGDLVTPFSNAADSKGAVVSMADMSTLEVEADVSESSLAQGQGRPAGGDRARCAARRALSRPHQPHGADHRPREGDRDDEGQVRRDRPAHPARDERQGELPVAGRDAGAAEAARRGERRRDRRSATAARSCSSCATARRSRCRSRRASKIGDVTAITGAVKCGEKAVAKPPPTLASDALVKVAAK